MKPERIFTSELTASFKQFENSHQIFYHRIDDDPFSPGLKFTKKKRFDGLMWGCGDFGTIEHGVQVFAMEYKAVNAKDRFYIRELKDHQIAGLKKAENGGASPIIIINFRGLEGKEKTKAWAVPLSYITKKSEAGIKALTLDMIAAECYHCQIPRIKLDCGTYGWNVLELFGGDYPYEKKENL